MGTRFQVTGTTKERNYCSDGQAQRFDSTGANIKDGTKTVGRGLLYDGSGKGIYLSMSAMEDSLFNVTIFFDEYSSKRSEYIANTMMAVIMTADPTLSTAEVESLAVDWIDSVEDVSRSEALSRVSKNGITYTLASWDNDDVWAVDVQVE